MSTPQVVIMTDEEVDRFTARDAEKGFGALVTPQGPLPLKTLDLHTNVEGLMAETALTQTFVNTFTEPLEATYIFPLPDRAAVTRFRLEVAARVVEGVLKERAAARQEYEAAIEAGHRAAITEEERPGVFTMRVGNLPAGETATVRLSMVGPAAFEAGEVTVRFPLVVAPRYIPGTALAGRSVGDGWALDTETVPDASRITPPVLLPGYPYPVRLSLTVDVQCAGLAAEGFRSSLHAVTSETVGGATRITMQPGERLNRDFILRYRLGDAGIGTSLTLVPDTAASGQEGTYVLTVVPGNPQGLAPAQSSRPRDVVFVLDRSGSMAGWKMVAARRALGRMIDTLVERDRFSVYAFDDTVEMPPGHGADLVSASDRNRFRAVEWLGRIDARGGTEMARPLDQAVHQLRGDRDRVLVLVTDGQVGNEDQILQLLGQRLKGIRIFTLGVDRAVNEAFLKRLAALGGGLCDVVESEDRLDEVMDKVQRRIGSPQWTGLHIEASGLELEPQSQVPARLPDVFAGVALTVMGRYRGEAKGEMTLRATDNAGQPVARTVRARVSASAAVAPLWARGRLRDLEDQWVVGGDETPAQQERRIVNLSLRFGVLCRFTAFVAVDRSEVVNAGGQQHQLIQPVEAADGWDMLKVGQASFRSATKAMMATSIKMPLCSVAPLEDSDHFMCTSFEEAGMAALSEDPTRHAPAQGCGWTGRVRKVLGAMLGDDKAGASSIPEVDVLAAYRQRARDMLESWRVNGDRRHALGVLAVQLQALLEDMKSIGIVAKVLKPLEMLLAKLQSPATSETKQVEQLWLEAQSVLDAFAGPVPSPA
jgi:Ca-activated chloride channel homolog